MDGEKDLAQWVTTCNIDLFEQHITLRFPLVRLMNRLLIWCPLIKNWDHCQALLWFDVCSSFWTHHDTYICNAVPLWCTDCKHLELLTSCQRGLSYLPLDGNVELLTGTRATSTNSYQEGGNTASDMAQNRVSVRAYGESQCTITMQITALHSSVVYMLLSIKSNPCIRTSRYTLWIKWNVALCLFFHKLTVCLPPTHSHTDKLRENPLISPQVQHVACRLCYDCVFVSTLLRKWKYNNRP